MSLWKAHARHFDLHQSLAEVERRHLAPHDYNLAETFGQGKTLTLFNSPRKSLKLVYNEDALKSPPRFHEGDHFLERTLLAYQYPPFITPPTSPVPSHEHFYRPPPSNVFKDDIVSRLQFAGLDITCKKTARKPLKKQKTENKKKSSAKSSRKNKIKRRKKTGRRKVVQQNTHPHKPSRWLTQFMTAQKIIEALNVLFSFWTE